MPALNVFEFAQRIQEYVTKDLGHPKWSIAKIVAVYSTRSKNTKFGYKVAPLFAGAIATDENGDAYFRGFYGEYDAKITVNGKSVTRRFKLSSKSENEETVILI